MSLFYLPHIGSSDIVVLDPQESRHCLKVLRKKTNDTIMITDGHGGLFYARLLDEKLSGCSLAITEQTRGVDQRNSKLHLAVSLIKNPSRFEWFLEKITEIGVGFIVPIICERTEKHQFKPDRFQNILVSAMKQSGRTVLPSLQTPVSFSAYVRDVTAEQRYIAWCGDEPREYLGKLLQPDVDTVILIGPEGDYTSGEVTFAVRNNFLPVSLGNARLRTETAGVMAGAAYNLINDIRGTG